LLSRSQEIMQKKSVIMSVPNTSRGFLRLLTGPCRGPMDKLVSFQRTMD
jgi:hypothetical protein